MKLKSRIDISKFTLLFTDIYFLLTLVICIILVVFKFSDFSLPYFSDELWVYGPSVRKMGSSIPSMLPNSLALEDHWGHPLLFFFIGSIWCLIFGTSIFSTHLFAVIISITLLISIYLIGEKLFNKEVGFYTVLIFSVQSIFIGQFSLVLPEVLLTLLIFLTIYFFSQENTLMYLLVGSCLVLTKETGIFLIVSIGLWNFIKDIFYEKEPIFKTHFLKKYFILILPLLVLGIHFVLLKITYGWFLLPERIDAFEFSWEIYHERIMHSMHYIFIGQGRKPIIIILFIAAILFKKNYPIWVKALILLTAFSMMKVFFKYWKLPEFFGMVLIPLLFIVLLKLLFWDVYKTNRKRGNTIAVFSIFIVIYLLFSSAQFDSLRYLLCIIPIYIMMGMFFAQNILPIKKFILPIVAAISIGFSFYYISTDANFGDDTNNYSDMCKVRIETIQFLENNYRYSQLIQAPFLLRHAITRPLTGYLKSDRTFTNVISNDTKIQNKGDCIYIFENTNSSEYYNIAQNINFELIHRFEKKSVWIEIYSKKQKP